MKNFNNQIYKNIIEIMKKNKMTTYELSRKHSISRSCLNNKLLRLNKGLGISTTSLNEIANILDVPVYFLIKE